MQQHREAEGDCRQKAVEHAEQNDCRHRGQCDQPIALPAKVRPESRHAQRLAHGVDDDRGQDRRSRAQAGGARSGAGRFVGRRARVPGTDRRTLKCSRHEVRNTERNQIAIRLYGVVVLQREGADRTIGFRVQNEHERERELHQRQPTPTRRYGECRQRQGKMDGSGQHHTAGAQPRSRGNSGNNHHHQARDVPDALQCEQGQQRTYTDYEARRLPGADVAKNLGQQAQKIRAVRVHADDVRPLLHGNDQGQPE